MFNISAHEFKILGEVIIQIMKDGYKANATPSMIEAKCKQQATTTKISLLVQYFIVSIQIKYKIINIWIVYKNCGDSILLIVLGYQ